jgi:hypothetical protein
MITSTIWLIQWLYMFLMEDVLLNKLSCKGVVGILFSTSCLSLDQKNILIMFGGSILLLRYTFLYAWITWLRCICTSFIEIFDILRKMILLYCMRLRVLDFMASAISPNVVNIPSLQIGFTPRFHIFNTMLKLLRFFFSVATIIFLDFFYLWYFMQNFL